MRVYNFMRGGSVAGQMEFWIMSKQQPSAIGANTSPHTVVTVFVLALCNRNLRSETEGGRINGFLTGSMNGPAVGSYKWLLSDTDYYYY